MMKISFKKYLKMYRGYTIRLLANKQSWFLRPLYMAYDLYVKRYGNIYFSGFGEDVVLQNLFHRKEKGIYIDIGCWHPKWGSNTYLLHKKGWKGVNIDIDAYKIDMFNMARKDSTNICVAVSNKEKDLTYFCSNEYSSLNTIDQNFAEAMLRHKQKLTYDVKHIRSKPLNNILADTPYANKEIDLLTIDIEGHELPALQSLNFEIYRPKVIVVELHEENIEAILKNEVYLFIKSKDYSLFSWTLPSLIFVRNGYPIKSSAIQFSDESAAISPST